MIQFRVRAKPVEGEDFILEQFEARSDAEQFYGSLQQSEGNILESVPYDTVVICFEEFCNGQWTTVSRKLVGVR